jgi:hypothetical protein
VKTDGWPNAYNQHLYSDLTGTIRELRSVDNIDDTDTRFQPPLDTNNQIVQPLGEGYRLARSEILAPALSVSINKETPHERLKRDVPSDNSSTSAVSLQTVTAMNTGQLSSNDTNEDAIISNADANSWALSLSLSSSFDGSGSEESKLLLYL